MQLALIVTPTAVVDNATERVAEGRQEREETARAAPRPDQSISIMFQERSRTTPPVVAAGGSTTAIVGSM